MRTEDVLEGGRILARRYGLQDHEAVALVRDPLRDQIITKIEAWREEHGLRASSSLVREQILELLGLHARPRRRS